MSTDKRIAVYQEIKGHVLDFPLYILLTVIIVVMWQEAYFTFPLEWTRPIDMTLTSVADWWLGF